MDFIDEEEPNVRARALSTSSEEIEKLPRRLSMMSDSSVFSQQTSTPGRRVSIASNPSRRFSRSVSTYISPYSKWKAIPGTAEEKPASQESKITMENTYRTEPTRKLPEREVRKIIEKALASALDGEKYNGNSFGYLTKLLSARILSDVKALNVERYKLVCFVNIGSKQRQRLEIASRCLWNPDFDTSVSATFQNESLFAVASVYGIYFE